MGLRPSQTSKYVVQLLGVTNTTTQTVSAMTAKLPTEQCQRCCCQGPPASAQSIAPVRTRALLDAQGQL